MWTAIERLQQGESLNVQDVKTNLFWEFGKFTSRDGESMESYYSRFYKLMNEMNDQRASFTMQVIVQFLNNFNQKWSRFISVVKQREGNNTVFISQGTKPHSSNAPSYMQSSSTRQVDQNAAECVDERVALANLIANLTLDMEGKQTKWHDDLEYVKALEKEIDEVESEKADFSHRYDLLLEEVTDEKLTQFAKKMLNVFQKEREQSRGNYSLKLNARQEHGDNELKKLILEKPTIFKFSELRSFQTNQSVNKTNASDGLFKPVTQQNLPQNRNQAVRNINVLKQKV
ncbi:hypothetical protein Tco_1244655 [Tanacetum coccineum]